MKRQPPSYSPCPPASRKWQPMPGYNPNQYPHNGMQDIHVPAANLANPLTDAYTTMAVNNGGSDHNYAFPASPNSTSAANGFNGDTKDAPTGTPTAADGAPASRHTRSYQACDACRKRKTKCVMGNPDRPHDGPCQKCARERKRCTFQPTRKKVKIEDGDLDSDHEQAVNTHKRQRTDSDASLDDPRPVNDQHFPSITVSRSPGTLPTSPMLASPVPYSNHMGPPPRSTPQHTGNTSNNFKPESTSYLRQNGASQHGDHMRSQLIAEIMHPAVASSQQGVHLLLKAAGEANQNSSTSDGSEPDLRRSRTYSNTMGRPSMDTDFAALNDVQAQELNQAVKVWSRMRFVRNGWFTPMEAITWINHFYQRLAPMTPVTLPPDYQAPREHYNLLVNEPVLALTILTIASRQLPLRGAASTSRSHNVHDKLWTSLRAMVERLLWGQEQFGGGHCGAGATPVRESDTGQISWKGSLRTLGTIEALLLLTDWQPRALHFPPPGDDEGHLLDDTGLESESAVEDDQNSHNVPFAFALEPAWRSDRMSWMLLGLAQSLSHELGVFSIESDSNPQDQNREVDYVRKRRIYRLVHTYVAQSSGRMGIKSMLSPKVALQLKSDQGSEDNIDVMHLRWLELASIMYDANQHIFSSHTRTRELTRTGQYKEEMQPLANALVKWKARFEETLSRYHPTMRHVLLMEYEYSRMFINSLGFNKVVEFWTANGPQMQQAKLVQITEENKVYINEVREASFNLVNALLEGFANKKQLRNAAIRTYLRSFAGMVFTLKLFSLGNNEKVIRRSLNLLERTAEAMQKQVVDDVHISNLIAEQVQLLAASVKRSMIRIQKPGGSNPSSRDQSLRQSPTQVHNYPHGHRHSHSHNSNHLATADYSPDPLAEIEARPIGDYSQQTFMPPPSLNMGLDSANGIGGDVGQLALDSGLDPTVPFDWSNTDWITLPLDNMLADAGGLTVEPGFNGVGPSIGDKDLLEFLAPMNSNLPGQYHGGDSGFGPNFGF